MKKSSIPWFFLLVTVVLAVHTAEAVEEMGGFVDNDRGGFNDRGIDERYDEARLMDTGYNTRRFGPPEARPEPGSEPTLLSTFLSLSLFGALFAYAAFSWYTHKKTSLMMVQVAIKNSSPEIQRHLSQIAKKWTMVEGEGLSSKGARGIMSDTTSHILLHSDRCFSAASYMELIVDKNSWKRRFEKMCIEQREQSNGRIVEQSVGSQVDEYVVVTVLVAAFGSYKLSTIHCIADLKKAFSCLQSAGDCTTAVKVFWTPPDGTSKIMEEELVEEFPQLKPLESQRPHYKLPTVNFRPPASVSASDNQSHSL